MQLILEDNDFYVKYSVEIDIDKINELRMKLIDDCSVVRHMCYKTTMPPNKYDTEHIRNYSEKMVRWIEYNDLYSMDEMEYLVEYDYYEEPELVRLIDSLLKKDASVINEIKEYCAEDDVKSMLESLNYSIIEDDIKRKKVLMLLYKEKILQCITLREVSRISKKMVEDVKSFFENRFELYVENDKKMIKK